MNKEEAIISLNSHTGFFRHWMSRQQRMILLAGLEGEEGEGFLQTLTELRQRIENMPQTYEQDGMGAQAVVYLHYFGGGAANFWITEKDMGDGSDQLQLQASGYANLFGGVEDAEFGYISIQEGIDNGMELDLFWTPKAWGECK